MSDTVAWNLRLAVQEGHLDNAKALMAEMVEGTRAESGAIDYEWFLSADGTECHICEKYADSAAALEHLGNFGANYAERFLTYFSPTAFHIYGTPSDGVRGILDGFGAVYMAPLGGFSR